MNLRLLDWRIRLVRLHASLLISALCGGIVRRCGLKRREVRWLAIALVRLQVRVAGL